MRKVVVALTLALTVALGLHAQDGPLTNAANLRVRTDANGYLISAAQTYSGPDGPLSVLANTLVRTDSNGYLIITNPSGFGGVSDHGALTGLSDDDHTQYILSDGTRGIDALCFDTTNADACLEYRAADTLAMLRSTNPQRFEIYNTYTDDSNLERLVLYWSSADAIIQTQASGTGTARDLVLSAASEQVGVGTFAPGSDFEVHDSDALSTVWITTDLEPSSVNEYTALWLNTDLDGTPDWAGFVFDNNNDNLLRIVNSGTVAADHVQIDTSGNLESGGSVTGNTLVSEVATGTAPLTVSSTTLVSNLNADLLDGLSSAAFLLPDFSNVTGTLGVANGGTGATTLTDGGILLGSGTGAISALGAAANGEIPIGDGTTDPVLATLTATANETEITNGAGSITVGLPDDVTVGSDLTVTDVLSANANGGHSYGGTAVAAAILTLQGTHTNTSGTALEGVRLGPDLTGGDTTTNRIAMLAAGLNAGGTINTQGDSDTIGDVATAILYEPGITVNTGDTVTRASTLKLHSAPTEGTDSYYLSAGSAAQFFAIYGNGQVGIGGSNPAISSCGTGATITGADSLFRVVTGTGSGAGCTVTFNATFGGTPVCVHSGINGSATFSAIGTTSLTFTSPADGATLNFLCMEPL